MTRGFKKISLKQWENDSETIIKYFNLALKNENKNKNLLSSEQLYEDIKLPSRATKHTAGYDIYSPFDIKLYPRESIKIPTGIKVYMEHDEFIMIVPRSSMGFKYYMRLANTFAVGDCDYFNNPDNEGHYWIKIRNEGEEILEIKKGQAFAQAIFSK